MESNDWFFEMFEDDEDPTVELAVGDPVYWDQLSEEEKYKVWSIHLIHGGANMEYVEFCETMDRIMENVR